MVWTLENIFYLLGIIFLIIMLITMIASLIGVILAIRKVKQLEQEVRARLAASENTKPGQVLKAVMPLVLSFGVSGGLRTLMKKFGR